MLKTFINKLINTVKPTEQKEGTVKFFNKTKGFGFIIVTDTEEEIFVHKSNLIDRIKEGNTVTFEVEQDKKGLTAVKVRKV